MTISRIAAFRLTTIIAIAAASLFALSSLVTAQVAQDRISLAISPQVLDLSANPGDTITNQVRLDNQSDGEIKIETVIKNFTARDEDGGVDLTEDQTSYSLAEWITVSPEVSTLSGQSSQDFTININVPSNAEPGGHFGSVVFKTIPPPNQGGAASVSQEIAPVILVKIAGNIEENATVESFESAKGFWSNENPIRFVTRLSNQGNVHFKPSGTITIKNMFGNEVTKINLEEKNVIPESIRRIDSDWSDAGFTVGRYTAELTVVYGDSNQILQASTTFIVFPYQTLVPGVLITVALLYVLVKFRKRIGEAVRVLSGRN